MIPGGKLNYYDEAPPGNKKILFGIFSVEFLFPPFPLLLAVIP